MPRMKKKRVGIVVGADVALDDSVGGKVKRGREEGVRKYWDDGAGKVLFPPLDLSRMPKRKAEVFVMQQAPKRYRKRWKKKAAIYCSPREIVEQILTMKQWDDIDHVLNHWMGRFNRKNYPPLIRVETACSSMDGVSLNRS